MGARFFPHVVAAGAALLAGGCQLLVTFEDVPGGTGGAGGAGGGGGGNPHGGVVTSSNACTSVEQCPDQGACVVRSCDDGFCTYASVLPGTVVADTPGDCVQTECDSNGQEVVVPADGDLPNDPEPGDCTAPVCAQGTAVMGPAPEGTLCGMQPNEVCEQRACADGLCLLQNKPDGTAAPDMYPDDCATTECSGGAAYSFGGANGLCGPDLTPEDCTIPYCNVASLPASCTTSDLPQNTPCKKESGGPGLCDVAGSCK
jgi:hypothetical protein